MDWSKIKTIFIISFFILDVYLLYQYLENRNMNQYEIMTQTSIEDRLAADEIEHVNFSKEAIKASYLSAKPKSFTKKELLELDESEVTTMDGTTLAVELKDPVKVYKNFHPSELNAFLKNHVIQGLDYSFWEYDEANHRLVYYQKYNGQTFYKNKNARLLLYLNKENEIIFYEQTLLVNIEEISDKVEVLSPLEAIETLYEERMLPPRSEITKQELGYYSHVQPTSQVLTPTWHFVINDEENVFVNALEGDILQLDTYEDTHVLE